MWDIAILLWDINRYPTHEIFIGRVDREALLIGEKYHPIDGFRAHRRFGDRCHWLTRVRQVAIAAPRHSLDKTRRRRVGFDFDPQAAHQLGQAIVADTALVNQIFGPDRANEIIFAADFIGVGL